MSVRGTLKSKKSKIKSQKLAGYLKKSTLVKRVDFLFGKLVGARLKIWLSQGSAGSIPVRGTLKSKKSKIKIQNWLVT